MHSELGPMVAYAYRLEPGYSLEGDLSLPDGWNWYDIDAKVAGSPDETGLAGDFDFELTWKSDAPPLAPPDPALVAAALQEQLGLKLEKRKRRVEILVVDHVEKPAGKLTGLLPFQSTMATTRGSPRGFR